jgi:hypothetical protein
MMHDREKSDSAIVAGKPTNKAGANAAEPVEPKADPIGWLSELANQRELITASMRELQSCRIAA